MNVRNVLQPLWTRLWYDLPCGPDGELKDIINELSCSQKIKMASVCKSWFALMTRDEMGEGPLRERRLRPEKEVCWFSVCRKHLTLPQTIVSIDKSSSMNPHINLTIKKACAVIADLGPALTINGVDCVVFGNNALTVKVFSVEDAYDFFTSDQFPGAGTCFTTLFLKIFKIQERYLEQKRVMTTIAHIISDFDEPYLLEDLLQEHRKYNIHFNCHRIAAVNKRKGEAFQNYFQKRIKVEEEPMQITRPIKPRAKRLSCSFSEIKPNEPGEDFLL